MSLAPAPAVLEESIHTIRSRGAFHAQTAIVLGSGLGSFVDALEGKKSIPFTDIPGFPKSTVEGHSGELVAGRVDGIPVLVNAGRVHFYEGYSLEKVIYPVRILHALGARNLILTNAAGSIHPDLKPGTLLHLQRLLNLTGRSILQGQAEPGLPFSDSLGRTAEGAAKELDLPLPSGCYAGLTGPSYETPAEIRYLRRLGADAVGMSTIHESIAAQALGMSVLGISCLTNFAAGILEQPLSHTEVIETGQRVQADFTCLLRRIVQQISP